MTVLYKPIQSDHNRSALNPDNYRCESVIESTCVSRFFNPYFCLGGGKGNAKPKEIAVFSHDLLMRSFGHVPLVFTIKAQLLQKNANRNMQNIAFWFWLVVGTAASTNDHHA